MEANGIILQITNDGRKYINVDVYIAPFTVKEAMKNIQIRKPTNQKLRTCTFFI